MITVFFNHLHFAFNDQKTPHDIVGWKQNQPLCAISAFSLTLAFSIIPSLLVFLLLGKETEPSPNAIPYQKSIDSPIARLYYCHVLQYEGHGHTSAVNRSTYRDFLPIPCPLISFVLYDAVLTRLGCGLSAYFPALIPEKLPPIQSYSPLPETI